MEAALPEVILAHEPIGTGCRCGAKAYPCFSVKSLTEINKGIGKEIERIGSLSDVDRDEELYGNAGWRYDLDVI